MTDENGNDEGADLQLDEELVTLPETATEEDVEFGTPYRARVNETEEYGLFVTLAGRYPNDVGGLVHKSNLPTLYGPEDFADEDTLAVQLRDRSEKGLSFELVKVLDGVKGTTGVRGTSVQDHAPADSEESPAADGAGSGTGSSPAQSGSPAPSSRDGLDAIAARLDDIEAHLASDGPTVRARVLDAGDDTTLLRVLDAGIEVEHGEVIAVTLDDTADHETEERT